MQQDRVAITWLLAALLGAGAFWSGLYAPGQQLLAPAVLAGLLLTAQGNALLSGAELAGMGLLALGAAASLAAPASAGAAAHGPLIVAGWLMALVLGRAYSGSSGWLERLLGRIWLVSGTFMVFGGIAAMSYLPAHHSGRLAAFLGYPIAVGVLGLLGLAGALPLLERGTGWAPALACANALAVWLSGSRGVWAALVLLAVGLAWARPHLLRRAWWPAAGALAGALWAGPAVAQRSPGTALLAAVLACLTVGLADWLHRSGRVRTAVAAGGAVLAAAAALAPGWPWLLGRATAVPLLEGSSVERLTFLRDGLALALDLPWGAGHRAWNALHLQAASYGYYSAEVHSALLDTALAFGWAGAAGFAILLIRNLWGLVRMHHTLRDEQVAVLGALGVMGLHALVDWQLSYAMFTVPLWLGFGLLAPAGGGVRIPRAATGIAAGLAMAGVVLLGAGDVAVTLADRALAAGDPAGAYRHAALATAVAPWSDEAHAAAGRALAGSGEHSAAVEALARARRSGPYEPWYAQLQGQVLRVQGRWEEAAAAYRDAVRLWPWHVPAYEEALEAHMDMAMRAEWAGQQAVAAELKKSARTILAALDQQKAKEPPGRPRRPIETNTPTLQRVRAYFAN